MRKGGAGGYKSLPEKRRHAEGENIEKKNLLPLVLTFVEDVPPRKVYLGTAPLTGASLGVGIAAGISLEVLFDAVVVEPG